MDTETPTTETETPSTPLSVLAAQMGEYHGEVVEPVQEAPEVTEEVEQPEESAQETSQEEEAKEEESEEQPISSFSELVDHLEADPEWADNLEIDVKINGEPGKAKIADLVKSYQIQEAAEQRLSEAKEKAKELTNDLAQKQEKVQEQFAVTAGILQEQYQAIEAKESALESGNLKKIDPAEYASQKLQLQDDRKAFDAKVAKATEAYQASVTANEAKMQEDLQSYAIAEKEALLEKIPEWSDPEVMQKEDAQLGKFLQDEGFQAEEISSIYDHRQILIIRDAMRYRQGQKNADTAKKKLVTIPKVIKPGASKPQSTINQEESRKAKERLKQTGSMSDALAALKAARG